MKTIKEIWQGIDDQLKHIDMKDDLEVWTEKARIIRDQLPEAERELITERQNLVNQTNKASFATFEKEMVKYPDWCGGKNKDHLREKIRLNNEHLNRDAENKDVIYSATDGLVSVDQVREFAKTFNPKVS
jgi:hypothetical protein